MAENKTNGDRRSEDEGRGRGGLTQSSSNPIRGQSPGTKRHLPRGIVIQLTGTEGEWDSLDDSELIFSLDHEDDYPSISLSKVRQLSVEDDRKLHSQAFHVPLSPSSPGSLGNLSTTGSSFLSPTVSSPSHRPLLKSLSTELDIKEGATLRPKPFLSLVKSISTEISRSEPAVSQSKSDSRLNLHLWKQLTQKPKTRSNGDSRTAPPSPCAHSPSGEGRGGFFKMELEDTKRKLSEAVHEPLSSMFSKIMREDSASSPKHQTKSQGAQQVSSRSLGREGSTDTNLSESPVRNTKRTDADVLPVFDWPSVKSPGRIHHISCPLHHNRQHQRDEELEICTDGDVMQVLAVESHRQARRSPTDEPPMVRTSSLSQPHPLPRMTLFGVALLSYGYFILPLSPYDGFPQVTLLGSFVQTTQTLLGEEILTGGNVSSEPDTLKGWMNEIPDYDPETFHPAVTHSVFSSLEGSSLRLDSPRNNISRRAAMWNPKYPICIQLAAGANSQEDEGGKWEESREEGPEPGSPQQRSIPRTLYLFGRTGREKEEWFRHFLLASTDPEREKEREPGRSPSLPGSQTFSSTSGLSLLDYQGYMSRLLATEEFTPLCSPGASSSAEPSPHHQRESEHPGMSQTTWANALIGRIFWDFLREKHWADVVSCKIQKKLSKIRLPYFMNELTLTELDMGSSMPQITATSRPEVNHRGLWVELQLVYTGALQMTLQTKFNLSKLGKEGGHDADCTKETPAGQSSACWRTAMRSPPALGPLMKKSCSYQSLRARTGGGKTGRKILRFVDKIAKSKYFQKATENEFIKKKFEEMSNTPLLLTVEVQELYSFCVPPKLDLRVRPKLGEREVTFCHVTDPGASQSQRSHCSSTESIERIPPEISESD
ncbi:hypothetical protein F7725_014040 [Dissostichus mawsoni]|uniref:SMP-LTD domain-containing protein n=1 Tax=Dissostichus mawsoni TaxID=36200 RepID=A0A7J5YUV0_DISMA|nr:hypothetical protein F7725_014040 [Dissostichus mawsoni]